MAKPRDYKAEYKRRILRGLERGLSRSQAAGHPRKGERHARTSVFANPFKAAKDAVNNFLKGIQDIFGRGPEEFHFPSNNEVEYVEMHDTRGIHILPRWSIGSEASPADISDFRELMLEVVDKRFQRGYAMVICGITETDYPGHEGEPVVCLSYRISRSAIETSLNNEQNNTLSDVLNQMLPRNRVEEWQEVQMIQIIDKD